MPNDGSARRGAKLAFDIPLHRGQSLQDVGGCRRRNRQAPVRAINKTVARGDGRGNDLVAAQIVYQHAYRNDARNRIDVSNLVEVNFIYGHAMRLRLGGGKDIVDRERIPSHAFGHGERVYERFDLVYRVMLVMVGGTPAMRASRVTLRHAPYLDHKRLSFRPQRNVPQAYLREIAQKGITRIVPKHVEQSPGKRILAGALSAVQIKSSHVASRHPRERMWFMRLAINAAPNPLSMLTTAMPLAHELSMASSAVTPPNDAP